MNFFGIGQSAEVEIVFDGADTRKLAEVKTEDGKKEKYPLYYDGETVSGRVNVTLKKPGSKLEHHGIRIELIGQIELYYDRGNHHEFQSLVRELARPGDLIQNTSYPFEFLNVEKPYEVYVGANVRLRYFLRVTIARRMTDIVREVDMAVHTLCSYPEINSPIKMEVGIEDCLHIEFEYNKSKYHLKDVTVGKIYFLLVRIKIKHMEIAIIKRETTGSGPNTFTENETIAKYEIMDGAPVKGESIPIRVFLAGYDLTPTMRDVNKKFSVRYYLNLVLMDTEDRRYFKQQEITLWRKADPDRKAGGLAAGSSSTTTLNNPHVPSHLVGADGEIIAKGPGQSTQSSAAAGGHQAMDDPLGRRQGTDEEEEEDGDAGEVQPLQSGAGGAGTQAASLFTQEKSPQLESKPLIRSGAPVAPPPLQATDSQDEPLFPAVPATQQQQPLNMQRGAGDGAAQTIDSAAPELTTSSASGAVSAPAASNSSSSPTAADKASITTTTEAIIESSSAAATTAASESAPATSSHGAPLFDETSALLKAALSSQVPDDDLVDADTDDIDSRGRTETKTSNKRQAVAVPE